jgi:hypothetical protein
MKAILEAIEKEIALADAKISDLHSLQKLARKIAGEPPPLAGTDRAAEVAQIAGRLSLATSERRMPPDDASGPGIAGEPEPEMWPPDPDPDPPEPIPFEPVRLERDATPAPPPAEPAPPEPTSPAGGSAPTDTPPNEPALLERTRKVREALDGQGWIRISELRAATDMALTTVKRALEDLGPAVEHKGTTIDRRYRLRPTPALIEQASPTPSVDVGHKILRALEQGPLKPREVAHALVVNVHALTPIFRALSDQGKIRSRGDGRFELVPAQRSERGDDDPAQ